MEPSQVKDCPNALNMNLKTMGKMRNSPHDDHTCLYVEGVATGVSLSEVEKGTLIEEDGSPLSPPRCASQGEGMSPSALPHSIELTGLCASERARMQD